MVVSRIRCVQLHRRKGANVNVARVFTVHTDHRERSPTVRQTEDRLRRRRTSQNMRTSFRKRHPFKLPVPRDYQSIMTSCVVWRRQRDQHVSRKLHYDYALQKTKDDMAANEMRRMAAKVMNGGLSSMVGSLVASRADSLSRITYLQLRTSTYSPGFYV